MKKTERFILAIVTIALGILLVALKGATVQIVTSVFAVLLIVLGVLDFISNMPRIGAIKCLIGCLLLAFGWLITSVVLYATCIVLFVVSTWKIIDLWRGRCARLFGDSALLLYLQPMLLALIGALLLFHQREGAEWIFVVAGVLTVAEGSFIFVTAAKTIE